MYSMSGLATYSIAKHYSFSLNTKLSSSNQESLSTTLANIEKTTENFSKISDSLAQANLAETVEDLQSTLNNFDAILVAINNGDGSIGKLLKDESLYNNLEAASKEMEELIRDIKLHPARYRRILSKKEIPYTPSEEN